MFRESISSECAYKTQCSAHHPACKQCVATGRQCEYVPPDAVASREADLRQIANLSTSNQTLRTAFGLLQEGPPEASLEIIRRIRGTANLDEALAPVADAALLLQANPSCKTSKPPPRRQWKCLFRLHDPDKMPGGSVAQPAHGSSSAVAPTTWTVSVDTLDIRFPSCQVLT